MNTRTKKRLIVVSGIIVIVLIIVLAIVGGGAAAKTTSVAEAVEDSAVGQKVQVSGNVVADSFYTDGNVLVFKIYDPEGSPTTQLEVRYDGAASSTFGNEVTAICTGKIGEDGVLSCTELVTKCPSKYENAESALTVSRLLEYGDDVVGKVVKVAGVVGEGSLKAAGQGERFTLVDSQGDVASGASGIDSAPSVEPARIAVVFDGALSDEIVEGSSVVLTGSIGQDGRFAATDVALEG